MNEKTLPVNTIFDISEPGRSAGAQLLDINAPASAPDDIPAELLRATPPLLPEVSELQVVRHYTNLSRKNFSIDTQFYPLGSCTMKYNPRGAHKAASLPGFLNRHPLAPESVSQGYLACLYELQEILKDVTGMQGVSLTPMAGAQGEFAGVAMIRAYHEAREDHERTEIIVPNAAHGTNPATAVMCGYKVTEVPVDSSGDVDVEALRAVVGPQTAGLMMTNPSTCGVFERQIETIAGIVHDAGGLLYYDGANLNAILGKVRPGDMGFDVLHMNLHKTFAMVVLVPGRLGLASASCLTCRCRLRVKMVISIAGWTNTICRTASAVCPALWAMPASCCGRLLMRSCLAGMACTGWANSRR